jgi:hypothetical protein
LPSLFVTCCTYHHFSSASFIIYQKASAANAELFRRVLEVRQNVEANTAHGAAALRALARDLKDLEAE